MSVYRWYLTMALSIAHRATGIALSAGLLLITWWLTSLSGGAASYDLVQTVMHSILGQLILLGWTFVLFFHAGNGVRHLFWDVGYGFDKQVARKSGMAVIGIAAGLTVLVWLISFIVA
jgi:succinate dehydrogenase / fumarate reductase cytochrome b subunit